MATKRGVTIFDLLPFGASFFPPKAFSIGLYCSPDFRYFFYWNNQVWKLNFLLITTLMFKKRLIKDIQSTSFFIINSTSICQNIWMCTYIFSAYRPYYVTALSVCNTYVYLSQIAEWVLWKLLFVCSTRWKWLCEKEISLQFLGTELRRF